MGAKKDDFLTKKFKMDHSWPSALSSDLEVLRGVFGPPFWVDFNPVFDPVFGSVFDTEIGGRFWHQKRGLLDPFLTLFGPPLASGPPSF